MARRTKSGPARMKELGGSSVQFFISASQRKALKELADKMGMPLATLCRRMVGSFVRGGIQTAEHLKSERYEWY